MSGFYCQADELLRGAFVRPCGCWRRVCIWSELPIFSRVTVVRGYLS